MEAGTTIIVPSARIMYIHLFSSVRIIIACFQVEGSKSMRLWRVPEVLIIPLKRFAHQLRFGIGLPEKLQDMVSFPIDGLDVSPYMIGMWIPIYLVLIDTHDPPDPSSTDQSTVYDLFATINHYGHANFGHYKAFVRKGEWHEWDPATGLLPSEVSSSLPFDLLAKIDFIVV